MFTLNNAVFVIVTTHDSQVRDLLAAGANTAARNKDGKTPLHMASDGNHLDVYTELIASGADIEAKDMFD